MLASGWALPGASLSNSPARMSDQYHLSLKSISRKAGRSSTAAAAYRSGELIIDERTGEVHDYRRKRGVEHSHIVLPGGGTMPRAALWNAVEIKHKRGDAVLVREIEIALPTGLNADQRKELVREYARELADRYGVAVDAAIHAPHPITDADLERDPLQHYVEEIDVLDDGHQVVRRHNGNWHAHVSMSACHFDSAGVPGKKCVELDQIHCQRAKIANAADVERPRWAELANAELAAAGSADRIDHRSHAARGIDRVPTVHLGPTAKAAERKTGKPSRRRLYGQQLAADCRQAVADVAAEISATIQQLETELASAVRDAAQAVAVAAIAVAAPSLALAEAPAPAQEARQGISAPVRVVDPQPAPVRALATTAVPVPDAVARQRAIRRQAAQLAELRKAELQAKAVASAAAQAVGLLGDPRGDLVVLRHDQAKLRSEREALERQIQSRGWIERAKARIRDPQAEHVAVLSRQAQDIGRQIADTTALVPQAERAAQAAQASAREARKATLAVHAAQQALTAAQAEAEQRARQVAQRLRQDEPDDPDPDASRHKG